MVECSYSTEDRTEAVSGDTWQPLFESCQVIIL
jgi:hypothetical protein